MERRPEGWLPWVSTFPRTIAGRASTPQPPSSGSCCNVPWRSPCRWSATPGSRLASPPGRRPAVAARPATPCPRSGCDRCRPSLRGPAGIVSGRLADAVQLALQAASSVGTTMLERAEGSVAAALDAARESGEEPSCSLPCRPGGPAQPGGGSRGRRPVFLVPGAGLQHHPLTVVRHRPAAGLRPRHPARRPAGAWHRCGQGRRRLRGVAGALQGGCRVGALRPDHLGRVRHALRPSRADQPASSRSASQAGSPTAFDDSASPWRIRATAGSDIVFALNRRSAIRSAVRLFHHVDALEVSTTTPPGSREFG